MAALRNEEAAKQFEAMLEVDPTNVSAHYNLMVCRQRLNQFAEARKEEVVYRLLQEEDTARSSAVRGGRCR